MRLWVTDRWEAFKGAVPTLIKCMSVREVNGDEALEIECLAKLDKGDRIVWQDRKARWHENIVDGVVEDRSAAGLKYSYFCPSSAKIELSGDYLEDKRPYNVSAYSALSSALSESRWAVGTVDDLGQSDTNFYHTNAWAAIHDVAKVWGGEIEYEISIEGSQIVSRKVNLRSRVGGDYGKRFTYTKDLIGVTREVEEGNVVTALYGYGASLPSIDDEGEETGGYSRKLTFGDVNGGFDWIGSSDALENFGRPDGNGGKAHVFGDVEFSDCEDPYELLSLTQEELEKRSLPSVVYTADVAALQLAGVDFEGADIGDTVMVIDKVYDPPLRIRSRITSIEEDQLSAKCSYTFGNWSDLADVVASQGADINTIKGSMGGWNNAANMTPGYLDVLIERLNSALNATGGYAYYTPGEGITTYDKPIDQNPTKAIQLMGGAFRIANEKNSDGTWKWRTFGTGDGFVADQIVSGTLDASLVTIANLLRIGTDATGTLEATSSGISIKDPDGAVVATYGKNLVEIGKNSQSSVIKLCGGLGKVKSGNTGMFGVGQGIEISGEYSAIMRTTRSYGEASIFTTKTNYNNEDTAAAHMYVRSIDLDGAGGGVFVDLVPGLSSSGDRVQTTIWGNDIYIQPTGETRTPTYIFKQDGIYLNDTKIAGI